MADQPGIKCVRTCLECKRKFVARKIDVRKNGGKFCTEKCYHKNRSSRPSVAMSARRKALRQKLRNYGLSEKQYNKMVAAQKNQCFICHRNPSKNRALDIDHDHKTGRVRGLLCWLCNKHKVGSNTAESAKAVWQYLTTTIDWRKA